VDKQATGKAQTGPGATLNRGRLNGSQGVTSFLKVTEQVSRWCKSVLNLGQRLIVPEVLDANAKLLLSMSD
jgi:hypothetical protein